MARKRKGFIELEWTCPNCETRNRGFDKSCANCGAPQPEDVQFEAPAQRKMVDKETASELEKRGADIHCGFCGTRNPSTAKTCSQCGGNLSEGKARQAGREIDMSSKAPEKVTCENCGAENDGTRTNCAECGAPLPGSARSAAQDAMASSASGGAPAASAGKKKPSWLLLGGIAGALAVCCLAVYLIFFLPSKSLDATVTDLHWQTYVPVQEIQAVQYDDETGNPPSDAYDVSCRTESTEYCEEKTIDRGDGSAEVVEECHTEDTKYCNYTVDEWTTIQTYTLEGFDLSPVYEQPDIASSQRLGDPEEDFEVTFSTDDGSKVYTPDTVTEFQQFQIGSTWMLKLNALGGVVSVER